MASKLIFTFPAGTSIAVGVFSPLEIWFTRIVASSGFPDEYGFHNNFKRIRDIRGTTKDEVIVIIGIHIAFTIPVLGTIVSFIVLLMPGKITDNGPGLDKIKDVFTPAPSKPNENDQIMNIEKLHKLKEAGAITEEEFVKYKNEALRKIAG